MFLKTIVIGGFSTNCYIVGCDETKEAAVIDPGGSEQEILKAIQENGLQVRYVINTHGHVDHIASNREIKEATGAELIIHEEDANFLVNPKKSLLSFTGKTEAGPAADRTVVDGDTIQFGNVKLEVIHTPGHTPGGMCLKTGDVIFTGDTLFSGSVGRTDFPGGSHYELVQSIKEKLLCYSDDVIIYPGHGPSSTLRMEREYNPFL
ncbi:MAG: MBL fold metallo-hydrolase [Bacillota bacterium]